MSDIARRDEQRDSFIRAPYEESEGDPTQGWIDFRSLAPTVGTETEQELGAIAEWVVAHGLAEWRAMGD